MNTLINLNLAKLLKKKGFDEMCMAYWGYDSTEEVNILIGENSPTFVNSRDNGDLAAPTIAEVIMWLYEKHGIWISVTTQVTSEFQMVFTVLKPCIKLVFHSNTYEPYNSPTEAYESAIEYTLNNLI